VQHIAGRRLIRVADWSTAPASPVPPARDPAPLPRQWLPTGVKRLAVDLLPPVITRAVRNVRHRTR